MAYYLLPYQDYLDNYQESITQTVVLSLDGTNCIIETEGSDTIDSFTQEFVDGKAVNAWWFGESEEWRNWMTEEDYNGE